LCEHWRGWYFARIRAGAFHFLVDSARSHVEIGVVKFGLVCLLTLVYSNDYLLANESSEKIACKTGAYSEDNDLAGTNIRAEPNGKIVGRIRSQTLFSVTGYMNDWFEVSNFEYDLDDEGDIEYAKHHKHKIKDQTAYILGLKGWIHRKHVNFHFGGRNDAVLFEKPDEDSRQIMAIKNADQEILFSVLSCRGKWYKVKFKGRIGWVNRICLMTKTNCN